MSSWRWWLMRFGRKQNPNDERAGEVARLAQLPGTDKADLVRCAVQALLAGADVDRAGVWIDEGAQGAGVRADAEYLVFSLLLARRAGSTSVNIAQAHFLFLPETVPI